MVTVSVLSDRQAGEWGPAAGLNSRGGKGRQSRGAFLPGGNTHELGPRHVSLGLCRLNGLFPPAKCEEGEKFAKKKEVPYQI